MQIDGAGTGHNGSVREAADQVDETLLPTGVQSLSAQNVTADEDASILAAQRFETGKALVDVGTQTSVNPPDLPMAPAFARQQVLKDGNLVLNGSDFDDSRTISDIPKEPTPARIPKLKSIVVKAGSSSAVDLEAPPNVQRKLFAEVLSYISKSPIQCLYTFLTLCDVDPALDVPTFFADTKDLAHLLCIMPPQIDDPESESTMVEILEEDDDVVEILRPSQFPVSKKRNKKLKEPLPKEFLRRSKKQA